MLEQILGMDLSTDVGEPEIGEGYALLERFVGSMTESTLTELAVDYARLFLGVSRGSGAFHERVMRNSLPLRRRVREG